MSDIVEVSFCPICGEFMDPNSSDTVNYEGQLIHAKCVTAAEVGHGNPPEGHNPNNSYT